MSRGSPADIIPFARFLEWRQRRLERAPWTGPAPGPRPARIRIARRQHASRVADHAARRRRPTRRWRTSDVAMGPLRELLAIDQRQALEFFVLRLQDVSESTVDQRQLLYNASVLAHYAQVSTQPPLDVPAPANLSMVFDHFVADATLQHDRLLMETAGAQCLLLAGFFEDQMRPRHNIRWYADLGAGFFSRAASHEPSLDKARLLRAMAKRFEPWRQRHAQLGRELRDQPFLLARPNSSG
jgi:hypothetical protein